MHISFVNTREGINNSNVPLYANLARSEVRGTSSTTSSARNKILLRRTESVKQASFSCVLVRCHPSSPVTGAYSFLESEIGFYMFVM